MSEIDATITPQAVVSPVTPTTQSTAVNVDIEAISKLAAEKAEQKMDAVFKSMLTQHGLDPETAKNMAAEWKAKQSTPEKEIQALTEANNTLKATIEAEQQKNIAIMKGVPLADTAQADKVNACLTLAKSYVSDTVTYEQALDNALKIISFGEAEKQTGFVPTAGQSGGGSTQKTAADEILLAAQKAMGIVVK